MSRPRKPREPTLPHASRHKVRGKTVRVPRRFHKQHLDSGYHKQVWGEHAHRDHELLGEHPGGLVVDHIEGEPVYGPRAPHGDIVLLDGSPTTGPEFRLTWPSGKSVSVLCADVVREYLAYDLELYELELRRAARGPGLEL